MSDDRPVTEAEFREVVLQRLPGAVVRHWPRDTPPPREDIEMHVDAMVLRLRVMAYGEKHPKPVEFRAPADWWQAFRERWAPRWWLSRHPVNYRIERVDIWNIYPEFTNQALGAATRIPVPRATMFTRDYE